MPVNEPYGIYGGKDLSQVSFTSQGCFYKGQEIQGLIKLKILPDKEDMQPFLPFRCHSKNFLANCRKCVLRLNKNVCSHSDEERAFVDTFTILEIHYATQKLHYKIMEIYEVLAYEETTDAFHQFLRFLARKRISFSGFPDDVQTDAQKSEYCSLVNEKMNFGTSPLQIEDVTNNKLMKTFFKLQLNSLLGKLGQDPSPPSTVLVQHQEELESYLHDPNVEVKDIAILSDSFLQLSVATRKDNVRPNRRSNVVMAAYVTAGKSPFTRHG